MSTGNIPKEQAAFYALTQSRGARLWEMSNRKCHWCGVSTILTRHEIPNKATIDHVIPRYRGGADDSSNVVSACYRCNQRRNKEDHKGLKEGALLHSNQVWGGATVKPRDIQIDQLESELNIARSEFTRQLERAEYFRLKCEAMERLSVGEVLLMIVRRWVDKRLKRFTQTETLESSTL